MPKRYIGFRRKATNRAQYLGGVFVEEDGRRSPLPEICIEGAAYLDWTGGPASDSLATSIFSDLFGEPEGEASRLTSRSASAAVYFARNILSWLPQDPEGSPGAQSWSIDEEDLRRWAAANQLVYEARDRFHSLSSFLTSQQREKDEIGQRMTGLEADLLRIESEIKRKIIAQRPCHTCHGTSFITECPECHGKGMRYGLDPSGRPAGATCSACNGTGKNSRQNGECPICWGKGYEWRTAATGASCLLTVLASVMPILAIFIYIGTAVLTRL